MGELLIQQGTLFHEILTQKSKCNEERTSEIRNFALSIVDLFGGFTSDITNACRKFFKKLKIDQTQDESIIFLSKYIIDILNELSKKIAIINKKIEIDVIQPLNLFIDNQDKSHAATIKASEQMLYEIQSNNQLLKELNKNFMLNENSLTKTCSEKQLLKDIVENEIEKCNVKWQEIKRSYQQILQEIDSHNSIRCNFTLKMQISTVRLINRLVNSTSVDESLQEYEEIYCENETFSIGLKDEMRDRLGKLIIFQEMGETDIYELVSSQADQKQKFLIDDFVGFFTSRSNFKQDQRKFQESRSLILQEMRWTHYFLNKLKSNLYTQTKLNNSKFRQLATIIKYIFAIIVEVDNNEGILYNLLYISSKVRHKDQYLIKELGKHQEFWRNASLWQNIIEFIMGAKAKAKHDEFQPRRRLRLNKLFSRSTWGRNKMFAQKKIRSEKVIQDSKIYEIICEINYYMAKIQVEETFIFDFMLAQAAKFNISKENVRKLLEYHYMNKMITTNKVSSNYLIRKAKLEENYKALKTTQQKAEICVRKCIKFLPLDANLLQLLLVNKRWSVTLRDKVLKRYLIFQQNEALLSKVRLKLYLNVCNPPFTKSVYQRMINEIPEFTEHTQIIYLDARRSLGWDEKLRVQMIEVLRAFSYYHPDNGYLQGMNYLCQNILKMTDDTYTCYSIFEHLMNNQYYQLYTGNFDGLKIKIYQFMRILQRERTELYDHFRAEKLQGQHFLLSWAITLWGEMSGDLCWILWDGFILRGWDWWFKTNLWLLKVLEPELLKMNFQEIMKCFSDLHSTLLSYSLEELSQYGIDKQRIKKDISSIRIEKQVLAEIEKEYKLKSSMINEYLKNVYIKKK